MPKLEIDADIARAQTPPGWFYTDVGVYARIRERVFVPSWQFVADTSAVRVPTQVHPVTVLDGCVSEPVLLTRDKADRLHCLSNVCTHRGTVLCEGPGHEKALVCRYHGRRFDLDGTFRHMPEFEGVVGFPAESDSLAKVPFGVWGNLIFACVGASASGGAARVGLDEVVGPVRERMGFVPLEEFRFDAARSREYLVNANWALYVDNYLEGFHIPFVHASLNEALDYGEYSVELFPWCSLQLGIGKQGDVVFELPASSPDHGRRVAAYYWWLFPNTMLNFYPWGLSVNVVRPLGVDRTKVSFLTYVWREELVEKGAGSGLDRVEREDEAVVEAVQRGLRSRAYGRGRYSPRREQGVHHFHRLMAGELG
jgi:choline monooxygenase